MKSAFFVTIAALLVHMAAAPAADAPGTNADLKFMPADSNVLIAVRVDQILGTTMAKRLKQDGGDLAQLIASQLEQTSEHGFGSPLSNVDSLTMAGSVGAKDSLVVAVHFKQAVKAETILKSRKLPGGKGEKQPSFKEIKVGPFTLYESPDVFRQSFCIVSEKVMLSGDAKLLRSVLERKEPKYRSEMQAALEKTDFTRSLNLVMDIKGMRAAKGDAFPVGTLPGVDLNKLLSNTDWIVKSIQVGDDKITATGTASCSNPKDAALLQQQSMATIATVMKELEKRGAPKEILEVLGGAKVEVSGNTVSGGTTIPLEVILKALKAAQ